VSVCLSVCHSRYCIRTTKPILKLFQPSGSPVIEAFGTPCAETGPVLQSNREVRRCLTPETSVNGHGKLVLHPLRNVKPVQFMEEP